MTRPDGMNSLSHCRGQTDMNLRLVVIHRFRVDLMAAGSTIALD